MEQTKAQLDIKMAERSETICARKRLLSERRFFTAVSTITSQVVQLSRLGCRASNIRGGTGYHV